MNTRIRIHILLGGTAVALAGCTVTNPSLMFGDVATYGIRLGNDTTTGGGSVALGYKAQSVAVVPVSVLDQEGNVEPLRARDHDGKSNIDRKDAMSVFARFESSSPDSTVRVGQVFSTGLAAQALTMGYQCRQKGDKRCENLNQAEAPDKSNKPKEASVEEKQTVAVATDRPYQRPLLFYRSDVVGIDIGGSLAQQGLQFALGYDTRNLALIPVYAQGSNGKGKVLRGGADITGDDPRDVYSVLGQFDVRTRTSQLGYELGRYFATGVAARNLGESLGLEIAGRTPDSTPQEKTPATVADSTLPIGASIPVAQKTP